MNINNLNINLVKIILFLIIISYTVSIFFIPESFVHGGSAITNWAYFKDILSGFKVFDKTGLQEERWNYAEFRWGFYIFPIILNFFYENQINVLFITTPILILLSFLIFIYILSKKEFSIYSIIFFSVTWIIHPEINDFIYSFSTNGVSLFALSIITYFIFKFDVEKLDLKLKVILSLIFFWFYGIKETNLIFFPFLIFLIKDFNLKEFIIISSLALFLYLVESISIFIITDGVISYGRIFYQLFDDSPHAWNNLILSNLTKIGSDITGENRNTELARNMVDGAIFSRWYFTGLTLNFFYYIGLILSFVYIANKNTDRFIKQISWLYISYFFTLSFLLIQIIPPIPFIHLNTGIQIIGFPLALILFSNFLDQIFKKSNYMIFNFIALSFLCALLNIKSLNHYFKVGIADVKNVKYNLFNVDDYLKDFTNEINNFNCFVIKGDPLLLLHGIDKDLSYKHKKNIKEFINNDINEYLKIVNNSELYSIPRNLDCKQKNVIYKFRILEK